LNPFAFRSLLRSFGDSANEFLLAGSVVELHGVDL
jgi:hypothetical protein